jgi:RNA polymerase sigma-70 factor (ECF subfamily)
VTAIAQPEVEWARALLAGDESAFTPFVESFQAKIFNYSLMVCGHREDAEEVAQDTLLKLFESFDQLRDPERVKPWVFRIARNFCLMKRRKSVFAPRVELSLDELLPAAGEDSAALGRQLADPARLPEEELLRAELRGALLDALRELPENYRPVVMLRDVEGLSTAETAEVLELSEDVVKQRLHRGRLALRRSLVGYLATAGKEARR